MENTDKLVELAKPIVDWLKENGNPHTKVEITLDSLRITEEIFGTPMTEPKTVEELLRECILETKGLIREAKRDIAAKEQGTSYKQYE